MFEVVQPIEIPSVIRLRLARVSRSALRSLYCDPSLSFERLLKRSPKLCNCRNLYCNGLKQTLSRLTWQLSPLDEPTQSQGELHD